MENLQSARCSLFLISKVLAARIRKLITAPARKNKRTARMLANARKDHSIPLTSVPDYKGKKVRKTTCDPFEELTCKICWVRNVCEI